MSQPRSRRVVPPAITRAALYRLAVPTALLILGLLAAVVLLLAGAVLLGIVPYPGR
jgi:hypothetical protein